MGRADQSNGKEDLGKLIYAYREANGLTQPQLASLLRVHPSSISKWEHGASPGIRRRRIIRELIGAPLQ